MTRWSDAGLLNRHIMTLSGHRNGNSPKSCNARPTSRQLEECSNVFLSALNRQAIQGKTSQNLGEQSGSATFARIPNSKTSQGTMTFPTTVEISGGFELPRRFF